MKKIINEAIVIVLLLIGLTLAQRVGMSQHEGTLNDALVNASLDAPLDAPLTSTTEQTTTTVSIQIDINEQVEAIKIDPNVATLEELQDLPCIGPALAKRIVDYRNLGHIIKCAEDLLPISGIGPKTIEKMRPYLRFP